MGKINETKGKKMIIRFKNEKNISTERELYQELWKALNRKSLNADHISKLDHIGQQMVKVLDLLRALDAKGTGTIVNEDIYDTSNYDPEA